MKYINPLLLIFSLFCLCACSGGKKTTQDGYRFVSYENIPVGGMGKIIGSPSWDTTYHIQKPTADSFYVYSNFDSIRMKTPSESFGSMFRKVNIRAISWVPHKNYGDLIFRGTYQVEHLPGTYVSFYLTRDRSSVMQVHYTNPGAMNTVIMFHKDSINVLKKKGIILDPRDER